MAFRAASVGRLLSAILRAHPDHRKARRANNRMMSITPAQKISMAMSFVVGNMSIRLSVGGAGDRTERNVGLNYIVTHLCIKSYIVYGL
jgi:hypothetical protein